MQRDAMLTQLGYAPNEALLTQLQKIENNTIGYDKIRKHIMDLNDHLKVNNSFVALSNSEDYFKVKIEGKTLESSEEAHEKVQHFAEKFKITINKLDNKETYYIIGFDH
ncbi:MAG: hypothetical protein Q9M32_00515 [Sulfurimonas sp.]|nr:hypothetical protein [Sulfurimonas sp.]MDQ7059653.1 hypothetical protein [Sulfurimonas sp.]